jgi:hypothetical protein
MHRILIAGAVVASMATPTAVRAGITERNETLCQYQHLQPGTWTPREERRTAACVVDRFGPIAGGLTKLRAVGQCESGWWRFARNPAGYLGLFQHGEDSWLARVRAYQPHWWPQLAARWTNSRTQLVVTVRAVRASGWGAWSCA